MNLSLLEDGFPNLQGHRDPSFALHAFQNVT